MSGVAGASRTWKAGRFTCTLTIRKPSAEGVGLKSVCEWHPYCPKRMSARTEAQYQAGLDAAVKSLRIELGQAEDDDDGQ